MVALPGIFPRPFRFDFSNRPNFRQLVCLRGWLSPKLLRSCKVLSQDTHLPAQPQQFRRVRVPIQSVILGAKCGELTRDLIALASQLRVLFRERGLLLENLIL